MSYKATCICGLSRTYSTTGQAKVSLDAAHDRATSPKEQNCVRKYSFIDKESGKDVTPVMPPANTPLRVLRAGRKAKRRYVRREPVAKVERNHKPDNINFCPRCGFSMEVLRVASRVAERL